MATPFYHNYNSRGRLKKLWQQKGILIDGERLSHSRVLDDIVIMLENLGEANNMILELKDISRKIGLTINFEKD